MCTSVNLSYLHLYLFRTHDLFNLYNIFLFGLCVLYMYLALFYRCGVFIAHGADLHPTLTLLVSLPEKLLHDALRPLPIHCQRLSGVAKVSTVHHVSQNLHISTEKHYSLIFNFITRKGTRSTSILKYRFSKTFPLFCI